jgi:hypothetical protein
MISSGTPSFWYFTAASNTVARTDPSGQDD